MVHPPSRSEEIVERAIELAEDRGVAGVTTATLARRLGFTEAALYRYFPGKGAILGAALEQMANQLFAAMSDELRPERVASPDLLEEQLAGHIRRFALREGILLELLIAAASGRDASLQQSANAFMSEYVQRMVTFFEQLREEERLSRSVEAEELARMWVCQLLGGFVRCRISRESWDPILQPGYDAFARQVRDAARHLPAPDMLVK